MEEHAKTGTRPSSRFCVLHVWCQTPTMYYSWNDISAPGYCSVWAEYRQSQCQAGILNFLFAKLMNCYLYVLRDTPSRGQCFQLCPGRWFQPCSPHIPWASSCSLFAGKNRRNNKKHAKVKVAFIEKNRMHCGKLLNLVLLPRASDCRSTQPAQSLKHTKMRPWEWL